MTEHACTVCQTLKPASAFYKHKSSLDGIWLRCKSCIGLDRKARYAAQKTAAKDYSKTWKKNNKAKVNAYNTKHRAAKLKRTPEWLTPLQLEHIQLFYEAAAALTAEIGINFQVDHILPLQGKNVSGLHVPWNLQVITASDNASKRNTV